MSKILKTRVIVLKKINYGDTSVIVSLFSEKYGKFSGIVKGARSPKSKSGAIADILNHVEIVFYQKENRDLQLITQLELVDHFPKIRNDLNKLKYSYSIVELLQQLTVDHEPHEKIFRGTVKMLKLFNDNETENDIELLFIKFFIFFLKEIGYEFQIKHCSNCDKEISQMELNSFDFVHGILCENCNEEGLASYKFSKELFKIIFCISNKINGIKYKLSDLELIVKFLEKYLMFQVSEFKGLKAIRIY